MIEKSPARRSSPANMIAWVSLCLVVVGWGPSVEPQWRQVWASVGAFGLAAAVALVVNERMGAWRRKRELQRQQEAGRQVAERRLNHFAEEDKRLAGVPQETQKARSAK